MSGFRELVPYERPKDVVRDTLKRAGHVANQFGYRLGSHLASIAAHRELDRVEPRNEFSLAQEEYMDRASGRNFRNAERMMNHFDVDLRRLYYGRPGYPEVLSTLEEQANAIMADWPNNDAHPIPAVVEDALTAFPVTADQSAVEDLRAQIEYSRPKFLQMRESDRLYDKDKAEYYRMLQDVDHPLHDIGTYSANSWGRAARRGDFRVNALYLRPEDLEDTRIARQYSASDLFLRRAKRVGKSWYYRTHLPKLRRQVHAAAARRGVSAARAWADIVRDPSLEKFRTPETFAYMVRDGSIVDVLRSMKLNPYQPGVRA